MFCRRLSSRCAIFSASGLSRAFLRLSFKSGMSSSSSSSSPSSCLPSASSPSDPSSFSAFFPDLSFRISRCSSPSWRFSTVSRSSSSVRFCDLELISWESVCTSITFLIRSRTTSSRGFRATVSRTFCLSATESCDRPAAIMSARTDAEAGHRTRLLALPKRFRSRLLPPDPSSFPFSPFSWGVSESSSCKLCCTLCTRAFTSVESEASRSSSSWMLATWKGPVCVKRSTRKRDWPSTESVTTLTSLSPDFFVVWEWEAIRHQVPVEYSSSTPFFVDLTARTPI
mmetsp:Transcript_26607/g.47219  ORF Transcript_26607/g.47219 Transcript_26607/m.47219 type:complete len:284 (+) Transcript_26607:1264-2115(+)